MIISMIYMVCAPSLVIIIIIFVDIVVIVMRNKKPLEIFSHSFWYSNQLSYYSNIILISKVYYVCHFVCWYAFFFVLAGICCLHSHIQVYSVTLCLRKYSTYVVLKLMNMYILHTLLSSILTHSSGKCMWLYTGSKIRCSSAENPKV